MVHSTWNSFAKTNIVVTIFLISIKIGFYSIFVVAMVTKFNYVLQNLTFLGFNLYSTMCSKKHKYQELFLSLYMAWKMTISYK